MKRGLSNMEDVGWNDALRISNLNTDQLLSLISARFKKGLFYTAVGDVVIAANPFRDYKECCHKDYPYDITDKKMYFDGRKARGSDKSMINDAPHLYQVGSRVILEMNAKGGPQSVLITGESGSGKTESTKRLMEYITWACGAYGDLQESGSVPGSLENLVLGCNDILEAFGNACTFKNANSSRFGKWIELQFGSGQTIEHAVIRTYMLELSRVTSFSPAERNYHIFHRMFESSVTDNDAAAREVREQVAKVLENSGLGKKWEQLKILTPSVPKDGKITRWQDDSIKAAQLKADDYKEAIAMTMAFKNYGFTQSDCRAIYSICASVALLSEVTFVEAKGGADAAELTSVGRKLVEGIAGLLLLSVDEVERALMQRQIKGVKELKTDSVVVCRMNCEAAAKTLYMKMFDQIVKRLNSRLGGNIASCPSYVGILDIAGFEIFQENSLEQLLINYSNENLQQVFTDEFIKSEMEVYSAEGLADIVSNNGLRSENASFNNRIVIEMIGGPVVRSAATRGQRNIASLLKDVLSIGGSGRTDSAFMSKISEFLADKDPHYAESEKGKVYKLSMNRLGGFVIRHYAGEVPYMSTGWVEKGSNKTPQFLPAVTDSSGFEFLKGMLAGCDLEGVLLKDRPTVATDHVKGVSELMAKIHETSRHYIRCIKSNPEMTFRNLIEEESVTEQLRCSGVLEMVNVRQAGYPYRLSFAQVVGNFAIVLDKREREAVLQSTDMLAGARAIIKELQKEPKLKVLWDQVNAVFGKSMVFGKGDIREVLQNFKEIKTAKYSAVLRQWVAGHCARLTSEVAQRAIIDIAPYIRGAALAQTRVPDTPGGLYLYPSPLFNNIETPDKLLHTSLFVMELIRWLENAQTYYNSSYIHQMIDQAKAIASRMCCEGFHGKIARQVLDRFAKDNMTADDYSFQELVNISHLVAACKAHCIYSEDVKSVYNLYRLIRIAIRKRGEEVPNDKLLSQTDATLTFWRQAPELLEEMNLSSAAKEDTQRLIELMADIRK